MITAIKRMLPVMFNGQLSLGLVSQAGPLQILHSSVGIDDLHSRRAFRRADTLYLHLPPHYIKGVRGCLSNKARAGAKQEHDWHRQLLQMIASW